MQRFFLLICTFWAAGELAAEQNVVIPKKHRAFLENHCTDCHNAKKTKGKVRLDADALPFTISTIKEADLWQKILTAINSEEMPPEDETQPKPNDKRVFLEMLSNKLVEARSALSDSGGKIVMRRLNRREYKNSMESLLGITVDVSTLPSDQSGSGFDTHGGSLFMSSDQIEAYLTVARGALKDVLHYTPPAKSYTQRIETEKAATRRVQKGYDRYIEHYEQSQAFRANKDPKKKATDFGLIDARDADIAENFHRRFSAAYKHYLDHPLSKTGSLLGQFHPHVFDHLKIPWHAPGQKKKTALPNGRYKIRARVGLTGEGEPIRQFIQIGTRPQGDPQSFKRIKTFHVTKAASEGEIIKVDVQLTTNERNFLLMEKQTREASIVYYADQKLVHGHGPKHVLWVDWIEWEGPLPRKETAVIRDVRTSINWKTKPSEIRKHLTRFATAACRGKTPDSSVIDKLVAIYERNRTAKQKPLDAIIEPLAIILSTPSFLYVGEPAEDGNERDLSAQELAVRLALFLWSSPPDSELLARAADRTLLRGNVLSKQVDRMLADPRSKNFYESFTYQWLGMDRLAFFQFDGRKYPFFDDTLKESARGEIYATIKHVVDNKLSTNTLLKSDFIMIDGLLSRHYGIGNVSGNAFQKVKLEKSSVRGGLTGTAAVLAMGSDGVHTSPVERGAWVLRKILNNPPPPAPANVPQLSRLDDKPLTTRQKVKAHQEEPQCAHCHRKIDPIGFGMENFDAIGLWRETETVGKKKKHRKKIPIDASGNLYRGESFTSYNDLRNIFADHTDDFNRGLIEAMLSYALGRPVGFSDQAFVDTLQKDLQAHDNQLRHLIHAITRSHPFLSKK